MERKSLHYSDGKSDKFWIITLEGSEYRINYGRSGTAGQTQTKAFDTEAAAKQAYEKQIGDKLKKGYVEIGSEVSQDPDLQTNTQPTSSDPAPDQEQEKQTEPAPAEDPKPSTPITLERSLHLSPSDWMWATWRPRTPLPRPEPRSFDPEDCLRRLEQVFTHENTYNRDWSRAQLSTSMSREEAHFWFTAMTTIDPKLTSVSHLIAVLRDQTYTGEIDLDQAIDSMVRAANQWNCLRPEIAFPLHVLFNAVTVASYIYSLVRFKLKEYVEAHFKDKIDELSTRRSKVDQNFISESILAMTQNRLVEIVSKHLADGFKNHLRVFLTDPEIEEMKESLFPDVSDSHEIQIHYPYRPRYHVPAAINPMFRFAAYLGMHETIEQSLQHLTPFEEGNFSHGSPVMELIFGLEDPEAVNREARRLGVKVSQDQIRAWLAHTEYGALDWLGMSIQTEEGLDELAQLIQAPEAAPIMLELWLIIKKSQRAREWLEENPLHTIAGLIPVLTGQVTPFSVKPKDFTQAATQILSSVARKGYEAQLQQVLEDHDESTREAVRSALKLEKDLPLLDETTAPEWLRQHVQDLDRQMKKAKSGISWVGPEDLPRLSLGSHYLSDEQVGVCLFACKQSTLDSPHPLLLDLKQYLRQESLDSFIWTLFERWLTEGGSSKEKWAMISLGLLGSDAIALKLTPLIRSWPGESQHPRAVLGLECLRTIGSDVALMQINGIAQKIKYQGLKKRANECMEDIARQRNLSSEELEDRIIPDCGLDQQGQRLFDYGPRQFPFVLAPDLKPMIRDEKGKLKTSPPKPNSKDDPEKAEQAQADWKLMKKQIAELVKIQSTRLELAMVNDRRWSLGEFESLLARHPLMTHLVQRLVWAGYDGSDRRVQLFRVAEDQTFANLEDEDVDLSSLQSISIPHPITLPDQERLAWGQLFSDYGIISPFPQVDRDVYSPQPEEKEAWEIKRFAELPPIDGVALMRVLEGLGWRKGDTDQGELLTYYRQFPHQGLTAFVGDFELSYTIDFSMGSKEVIDGCCFISGLTSSDRYPGETSHIASRIQKMFPNQGTQTPKREPNMLQLKDVDPIAFSETVRDLRILLSKDKS